MVFFLLYDHFVPLNCCFGLLNGLTNGLINVDCSVKRTVFRFT